MIVADCRSNGGNIITRGAGHGNELKRLEDPIHLMSSIGDSKGDDECESMFNLTKEQITVQLLGLCVVSLSPLTSVTSVKKQYVDARKLSKIEAKQKQKLEKRENKPNEAVAAEYDASKNASASQSISSKQERQKESDTNRSFDIIIENFDVSFGNK